MKDLIGKKFGKLIVLSKVDKPVNAKSYGSYWLCLCNCGNKKVIKGKYLLNGHSKTCGCEKGRKRKDISGKRFGRLLAIKIDYVDRVNGAYWLCKCDCGNEKTIRLTNLTSGNTISCGCKQKENYENRINALEYGVAAFNEIYAKYQEGAKKRNLVFELDKDYFTSIINLNCYYCGCEPNQIHRGSRCNGSYIYNGIDRVDNSLGYIIDNCVPCCGKCNRMKSSLSQDEFLNLIKNIYLNKIANEN